MQDRQINNEEYTSFLEDGGVRNKSSGDLIIGDIIKIPPRTRVPADIVILHCNDKNNRAYVKTDQLDGETDLKLKKALEYTQNVINKNHSPTTALKLRELFRKNIEFVADKPNNNIYKFEGVMQEISATDNRVLLKEPIT